MAGAKNWTEVELQLLRWGYAESSNADLAQALGRTKDQVSQKAHKMGLKKSPAYLAEQQRLSALRLAPSGFQHGQKPHNAGRKGVCGVQEGCKKTQFPKLAHPSESRNYKPLGSQKIGCDGYLVRKVTDDEPVPARRWVAVHRLVWEAAHGPVPARHVVRFKEGMFTTDEALITLDRLECISWRENMRRNSLHTIYPPEVVQLVQLRGVLTRTINQRSKDSEP